jgi:hypothetical protein
MSERGMELLETADGQISELIDLLSARGAVALSLPCSGREKVGDSTVPALALHTVGKFLRIAGLSRPQVRCPGRTVSRARRPADPVTRSRPRARAAMPTVHTTMACTTAAMQRSTPI